MHTQKKKKIYIYIYMCVFESRREPKSRSPSVSRSDAIRKISKVTVCPQHPLQTHLRRPAGLLPSYLALQKCSEALWANVGTTSLPTPTALPRGREGARLTGGKTGGRTKKKKKKHDHRLRYVRKTKRAVKMWRFGKSHIVQVPSWALRGGGCGLCLITQRGVYGILVHAHWDEISGNNYINDCQRDVYLYVYIYILNINVHETGGRIFKNDPKSQIYSCVFVMLTHNMNCIVFFFIMWITSHIQFLLSSVIQHLLWFSLSGFNPTVTSAPSNCVENKCSF